MALTQQPNSDYLAMIDPDGAHHYRILTDDVDEDSDGTRLAVYAEVKDGWEHVTVSTQHRCPTWDEMAFVRDFLWHPQDCVMQLHPPMSRYCNLHPYCLHLWRPIDVPIPQPPIALVGAIDWPFEKVKAWRGWAGIQDGHDCHPPMVHARYNRGGMPTTQEERGTNHGT